MILGRLPESANSEAGPSPVQGPAAVTAQAGQQRRQDPARGLDIQLTASLSFAQAYVGCEQSIHRSHTGRCGACQGKGFQAARDGTSCPTCRGKRQSFFGEPCASCNSTGVIAMRTRCGFCAGTGQAASSTDLTYRIPAGCRAGEVLCFRGEGERGAQDTGLRGDLYVTVDYDMPALYSFDSDGLLAVAVPVSVWTWLAGGVIQVPSASGDLVPVTLGYQATSLQIEGAGWPTPAGDAGALRVKIAMELPKPGELNADQLALLGALDALPSTMKQRWDATISTYLDRRGVCKEADQAAG